MINIKFNIDYQTQLGEELCISGSIAELGSFNQENAFVLTTDNGYSWFGELEVQSESEKPLEYYYFVRENGVEVRREESPNRSLMIRNKEHFIIKDYWKEQTKHSYLYTSVFTECVFKQSYVSPNLPQFNKSIILNVICPFVQKNEHIVISGERDALGNWDLKRALPLSPILFGEWQIELNAVDFCSDVSYKFAIVKDADLSEVHWENGENRTLEVSKVSEADNSVYSEMGLIYKYPSFSWKGVGVSIPLFSLKTETSSGIGDFLDLKKMVDWAEITNQNIIQILPINDTNSTNTWKDSYPYSSISIFALNPVYISIDQFTLRSKKKQKTFLTESKRLNALAEIDYEKVSALKYSFLRDLFTDEGLKTLSSAEFIGFYKSNIKWLFPYICFCYLRDKHNTANFKEWDVYSTYQPDKLIKLLEANVEAKNEASFYAYLQFLAHNQLEHAKEYAHSKGIALKGDIPIGINKDSVEAWTEPHLFNMQMQAGAPPDDFSMNGQNWGFPTYNWIEMERDDYKWWKERFIKMSDYFDSYRIDHILGFFRIWEMPSDNIQGVLGHFSPALPLSKEELTRLDFPFDEQRMTQPYIHEEMLINLFGEYVDEAISQYLDVIDWQRYQLKPNCDTQQKINQIFIGRTDAKSQTLREGLFNLCAEVLFVPDPYQNGYFHPRITAQQTTSYAHLDEYSKDRYNEIYNNFFYERHNSFWYEQAMQKLPQLISATSMLVCGEDLGMVPDCVNWVMDELRILSLEIQRMPKESNVLFSDLNELPYLSVNTTSTHDMSTIRGWWLENRENTQYYYNKVLGYQGNAPSECTPRICEDIVRIHLNSRSMWTILPWQDWLSIDAILRRNNPHDERINDPSNSQQYWRYRMHISLENLLQESEFNERIKYMIR